MVAAPAAFVSMAFIGLQTVTGLPYSRRGHFLEEAEREAEIDILRYLLANQDARDSIEGIVQWWLPQSRRYTIADVSAALRNLASRKLIRVWESQSTKSVYGLGDGGPPFAEDYLRSLES